MIEIFITKFNEKVFEWYSEILFLSEFFIILKILLMKLCQELPNTWLLVRRGLRHEKGWETMFQSFSLNYSEYQLTFVDLKSEFRNWVDHLFRSMIQFFSKFSETFVTDKFWHEMNHRNYDKILKQICEYLCEFIKSK